MDGQMRDRVVHAWVVQDKSSCMDIVFGWSYLDISKNIYTIRICQYGVNHGRLPMDFRP